MSKNSNKGGKQTGVTEGYNPNKIGKKPGTTTVIGGHTPEKSQQKPVNPPKRK